MELISLILDSQQFGHDEDWQDAALGVAEPPPPELALSIVL